HRDESVQTQERPRSHGPAGGIQLVKEILDHGVEKSRSSEECARGNGARTHDKLRLHPRSPIEHDTTLVPVVAILVVAVESTLTCDHVALARDSSPEYGVNPHVSPAYGWK